MASAEEVRLSARKRQREDRKALDEEIEHRRIRTRIAQDAMNLANEMGILARSADDKIEVAQELLQQAINSRNKLTIEVNDKEELAALAVERQTASQQQVNNCRERMLISEAIVVVHEQDALTEAVMVASAMGDGVPGDAAGVNEDVALGDDLDVVVL